MLKQRCRCEPPCTGGCARMAPSLLCVIGRDCLRNEERRGALQSERVARRIQSRRAERKQKKSGSLILAQILELCDEVCFTESRFCT